MYQVALLGEVQQLQRGLQEIEARLATESLPLSLLEEFKEALDHVRTTLWAVITAKADPDAMTSAIVSLRMKRTTEMCRQIMMDIDALEIGVDSPELPSFREVLQAARARVERLYSSGM